MDKRARDISWGLGGNVLFLWKNLLCFLWLRLYKGVLHLNHRLVYSLKDQKQSAAILVS